MENIRTKGFWLSILMMPVILALIAVIPVLVSATKTPQKFTVYDQSGWLLAEIQKQIDVDNFYVYLSEPVNRHQPTPLDRIKPALQTLNKDRLKKISRSLLQQGFYAENHTNLSTEILIYLNQQGAEIRHWWHGLSPQEQAELSPRISHNRFRFVTLERLVKPGLFTIEALNQAIQAQELFAYFVVGPMPVSNHDDFRFVSNNLTDRELLNWLSHITAEQVRAIRVKRENLDPEIIARISRSIDFKIIQIDADGQAAAVQSKDIVHQWAPVVCVYLLWVSVLINTQMLLTNIVEEKSNKLIEVLLSSISPVVLMAGKIMGIAITGLTIIVSWVLMALTFFLALPLLVGINLPLDIANIAANPILIGSFVVYFLLGYLLYAAILVGLGSVCNNLKEAQNLMLPVQLIQILPLLLMVPIGRDPNGILAQVLSYIPPLTPFVMMNRAAAPPTMTEYMLTTGLLIISIAVALWLAAKVFRVGILLTGNPPGLMEIARWLRAPVAPTVRVLK